MSRGGNPRPSGACIGLGVGSGVLVLWLLRGAGGLGSEPAKPRVQSGGPLPQGPLGADAGFDEEAQALAEWGGRSIRKANCRSR